MKTALIPVGVAALLLVLSGCGGTVNVSERVTAELGTRAICDEGGFEEVAAEREETWDCTFTADHTKQHVCVAIVEGDVSAVRTERC